MKRLFIILILLTAAFYLNAQLIIDEDFGDWTSVDIKVTDPGSDASGGIDFLQMQVYSDTEYLYYRFGILQEINLQDGSGVILYIDVDNNSLTGKSINGIGVDVSYDFGQRAGYYHRNSLDIAFSHYDCGLITLPTVTSNEFEFAIKRNFNAGNYLVILGSKVKTFLGSAHSNGDKIPDQYGGLSYQMNTNEYEAPAFEIDKHDESHLRIMSYNVKQDGIFKTEAPYKRKIKAINPDILCFQEVYNYSSGDLSYKIRNFLGGTWYDAKIGSDIIVVSRYPISRFEAIGGNGAFLINYKGQDIIIINVHLYCCDNDKDRQTESDEIMQFIRSIKNLSGIFPVKKNTPVIITGDTNFVGLKQQRTTILHGDIVNESKYGKDFLPDWDNTFLEDAKPQTTGYPGSFTWNSAYSSYPAGRLDYMIYTGSVLQLENAYVLITDNLEREILDKYQLNTEDSFNSSDHLLVVADFSIKNINPINEITIKEQLRLYPNPVNEVLNIDLVQYFSKQFSAIIIDPAGLIVYHKTFTDASDQKDFKIDVSELKSSYYYILIYDDNNKLIEISGFVKQ